MHCKWKEIKDIECKTTNEIIGAHSLQKVPLILKITLLPVKEEY